MGGLLDILEELRLGGTRIAQKEHVDVASNVRLALDVLRHATKEGECDRSLDVLMSVNGGRNGLDDTLPDSVIAGKGANFLLVIFGKSERSELVFLLVDMIGFKDGREHRKTVLGVERRIEVVTVDAGDFLETQ